MMATNSIVLSGRVAPGFEEAGAFLSTEGYVSQIKEKMGFTPFPGTLNIKVEKSRHADVKKIRAACQITLDGFSKDGRKYGPVKAKEADLNGAPVFVVFPSINRYGPEVVEVISAENLRQKLGLKDGDDVQLKIGN